MALSRACFLLSLLLAVTFAGSVIAETKKVTNGGSEAQIAAGKSLDVASLRENVPRTMRAASAAPEPQQKLSKLGPAVPAGPNGQPEFEQQILVVKGNPSQERLNDEIRKALRALLGNEEGDQVQIRQLKDVDELRRVVPGAGPGPIGLKVVP